MNDSIDTSWNDSFDNKETNNSNHKDNDNSPDKSNTTEPSNLAELQKEINIFANPKIFSENDFKDIINNYIKGYSTEQKKYKTENEAIAEDEDYDIIDDDEIESMKELVPLEEEYILNHSDEESFKDFSLSDEGQKIILNEIGKGELNLKLLQIKLENAFKTKLHNDYRNELARRNIDTDDYDNTVDTSIKLINEFETEISNLISQGQDYNNDQIVAEQIATIIDKIKQNNEYFSLFNDQTKNDIFINELRKYLKGYTSLARKDLGENKGQILLPKNSEENVQLKTYLKFYDLALHPEKLNSKNSHWNSLLTLSLYLETEYSDIKFEGSYAEVEEMREERRKEMARKRRKRQIDKERKRRIRQINRELNSKDLANAKKDTESEGLNEEEKNDNNLDIKEMKGSDYADKVNLASQIEEKQSPQKSDQIETTNISDEKKSEIKEFAFDSARIKFLNQNPNININKKELKSLLNESLLINENKRNKFKDFRLNGSKDPREIQEMAILHKKIEGFHDIVKTEEEEKIIHESEKERKLDLDEKNHVLGLIIDNLKPFFDEIGEIEIKGNNMFIPGKLNNTKINIRYDLESGKVLINSFINDSNNSIILGDNTPNKEIISISSFNSLLSKYQSEKANRIGENINNLNHNSEEHKKLSDIIAEKLNPIGKDIQQHTKREATKIDICNKFATTFGVFDKANNNNTITLQQKLGTDNAFSFIQIINNSDETTLSKFSKFMDQLCKYSGLKRGDTNLYPNDTTENSEWIKNINNIKPDSDNLKRIIDLSNAIKPFEKEKQDLTLNKDTSIGIVSIIQKYCVEEEQPYRKLNQNKMEEFINSIPLGISEIYDQQLLGQIQ